MKRVLPIVLLLVVLAGCGGTPADTTTTTTNTTAAQTTTTPTATSMTTSTTTTTTPTTNTTTSDGSGDLVVSEIHADAAGNDHENLNDEYIVLGIQGTSSLDMRGWTIEDEADHTYTVPSGFSLDPGDQVTLPIWDRGQTPIPSFTGTLAQQSGITGAKRSSSRMLTERSGWSDFTSGVVIVRYHSGV